MPDTIKNETRLKNYKKQIYKMLLNIEPYNVEEFFNAAKDWKDNTAG